MIKTCSGINCISKSDEHWAGKCEGVCCDDCCNCSCKVVVVAVVLVVVVVVVIVAVVLVVVVVIVQGDQKQL